MPSTKLSLVGGGSQIALEGLAWWHRGAGQWEDAAVWRPFPTVTGELCGDVAEQPAVEPARACRLCRAFPPVLALPWEAQEQPMVGKSLPN